MIESAEKLEMLLFNKHYDSKLSALIQRFCPLTSWIGCSMTWFWRYQGPGFGFNNPALTVFACVWRTFHFFSAVILAERVMKDPPTFFRSFCLTGTKTLANSAPPYFLKGCYSQIISWITMFFSRETDSCHCRLWGSCLPFWHNTSAKLR